MNAQQFAEAVRATARRDVFNPYADHCAIHDSPDAPERRFHALCAILEKAVRLEVDAIWIGRDLGYRGGRRTGLALTDDAHVAHHGSRWGLNLERATTGDAVRERTAAVIWSTLSTISVNVFLWNVFPFHPYEPGNEFTNRVHSTGERRVGEALMAELCSLLKPARLVALGNDAARSAIHVGGAAKVTHVRHPSYGGQGICIRQIQEIYRPLGTQKTSHQRELADPSSQT